MKRPDAPMTPPSVPPRPEPAAASGTDAPSAWGYRCANGEVYGLSVTSEAAAQAEVAELNRTAGANVDEERFPRVVIPLYAAGHSHHAAPTDDTRRLDWLNESDHLDEISIADPEKYDGVYVRFARYRYPNPSEFFATVRAAIDAAMRADGAPTP